MQVIALAAAAAAAGLASTASAAPAEAAAAAAAAVQPTPLAKRAAGGEGLSLKLPLQQWKRELNSPEDVIASARRQRDYIMDKYYGVFNTTQRSAYRKMRLQQKLAHSKRDGGIVGLTDVGPDSYYFAQLAIGTPAQNLAIVLDTGSADLWVPANECTSNNCRGLAKFDEQASSTYQSSSQPFSIQYGQGAVQGHMAADTVSLAGYTVYSQSFAVATQIADDTLSAPASGLMGMGFQQLSSSGVTPFWEVLAKSGKLAANAFSFQLARNPTAGPTDQSPGGVFTLGEIDSNQYSGSINYVSIPQRYQAYGYWAVNLDSISLNGGNNVQVNQLAAIDTGTTLIAAPTRTAQAIYAAIPGSAPFTQLGQGYYQYPCSTNVQVQFTFGGKAYSVNPVDFNAGTVDNFGKNCLGSIFGMDTGGAAPPFIVGDAFLKSVFSVYQYNPPAVGFASLKGAGAQTAATSGGLKTATDAAVTSGNGALPTDTGLPQGLTQTVDQTRATGTSIYGASGVSAPSAAGTNANKNPSLGGGSSSNASGGSSGSGTGRSAAATVQQPLQTALSAVLLAITAGAAFTIWL